GVTVTKPDLTAPLRLGNACECCLTSSCKPLHTRSESPQRCQSRRPQSTRVTPPCAAKGRLTVAERASLKRRTSPYQLQRTSWRPHRCLERSRLRTKNIWSTNNACFITAPRNQNRSRNSGIKSRPRSVFLSRERL